MKNVLKFEEEFIGECKGNNGNGCFMDSSGHDCGCFIKKLKQERMYSEEEVLTMLLIKHDGLTPDYVIQQFKKKTQ
jgi:hypothetical protein